MDDVENQIMKVGLRRFAVKPIFTNRKRKVSTVAGISAEKDMETAGGTAAGILITQFLCTINR